MVLYGMYDANKNRPKLQANNGTDRLEDTYLETYASVLLKVWHEKGES